MSEKMNYYKEIEVKIESLGFNIISKDFQRPWGGFLVIDEDQAQDFSNQFYLELSIDILGYPHVNAVASYSNTFVSGITRQTKTRTCCLNVIIYHFRNINMLSQTKNGI